MTGASSAPSERPGPLSGLGALPFPLRAAWPPALAVLALLVGGLLHIGTRFDAPAFWLQYAALILLGAPVALRTLRGMLRGEFAADVVAMLAIVVAIALREPVAGLVIVLMQTGGELLERYAEGRASAAVRELEAAAPRIAHRVRGDDAHSIEDVAAEDVAVGETILVRPGEMLPCDATVLEGSSSLDTSRVTGEPLPERVGPGAVVSSGVVNLQSPLLLRVTAPARESLYARIVDLVRTAQAQKAPIQRLADRWAVWFTPITLLACAIAWWMSGDVGRVLAVLVVATPCPLIIATPVAVIGGINRAARRSIVVRNGSALELLSRVDTVVFDKTGTLTIGRPAVSSVASLHGPEANELLRVGAAIEVGSGHLLARSTVAEARDRGLEIPRASEITEYAGRGVSGMVDGRRVTVGERSIVSERHPALAPRIADFHGGQDGGLRAFIAVGDDALGVIQYADRLRTGLEQLGPRLAARGLSRVVLLSGDHADNVAKIAREVGITEARGDQLPQDKVEAVRALEREGRRVLMVGDGTNDAPALAAATVGVALAAHGGGISAEAAGVVLLADDVMRVEEAVAIGQRTVRIAKQSIGVGLALSAAGMVLAALGYLPPTAGALVQEAIDVAVIVNALRAAAAEG
ncbi:MAG: heavy metal translocating P-type ATPase [Gemmatimonas sp.]|nr:heavy metal translocating P-type ATPase [Gemmatimonas sp.]